jgi:hypothetical protein
MERLGVRETGRWGDDETEKQEDGEMMRQRNRKERWKEREKRGGEMMRQRNKKMVRWRERENEKQSNKERQIVT